MNNYERVRAMMMRVVLAVILGFCFTTADIGKAETVEKKNMEVQGQGPDARIIDDIMGMKGAAKGDEYKITIPQKELSVMVDGFRITPPMGLSTWIDFKNGPHGIMMMGDIVLLENEIGAVEMTAIENGLSVTGLHNHFVRDSRKVMYMHIHGMGRVEEMAKGAHAVIAKVADLRHHDADKAENVAVENSIDQSKIESLLGQKGELSGGVLKMTFARPDVKLVDHGYEVSSFMGFNTWAAFQGTNDRAAVAGDFAMLSDEVPAVIAELSRSGIEVVALHNHMVMETPRIFFLHYWGVGPADKLAGGLKAALDRTGHTQKTG